MRIEHPVDLALRPYVQSLWSVERAFVPPADTFTLLPDRYVELVFSGGARFVVDQGEADSQDSPKPTAAERVSPPRVLPRAYVVGLLDGPVRLRAHGTVRAVAARCHAWNVAPLLAPLLAPLRTPPGRAAPDGFGGLRPLHAAHAPLADEIAARLTAGDVDAALGRLCDLLRPLAAGAPAVPAHVRRAGHALGSESGDGASGAAQRAPVRRAASAGGRTARQLERQFRALAGVTPKGYARRARFEQARDRLWAAPATRLSELAAACGYADQAHLTREFAAFAGVPPGRWAAGVVRTRALLHPGLSEQREREPDVAFVQDA